MGRKEWKNLYSGREPSRGASKEGRNLSDDGRAKSKEGRVISNDGGARSCDDRAVSKEERLSNSEEALIG